MDDKTMPWISVDDEMPGNDAKVLALYWDGEYDVVYGSTIRADRDNYKFWQPLPPPPDAAKAKEGE